MENWRSIEDADAYDSWYDTHAAVFQSELALIRKFIPIGKNSIEIGCGTGRFAVALGIETCLEPAPGMVAIARKRGLNVVQGVAENLPFTDSSFAICVLITSLCFIGDPVAAIGEVHRILKPAGTIILGILDPESPIGAGAYCKKYEEKYHVKFLSVTQTINLMQNNSFQLTEIRQTLFHPVEEIQKVEADQNGFGNGLFVVIAGKKI